MKISERLMSKYKIIATPIVHEDFFGVRVTPNIFTTLKRLDRFCSAIESMIKTDLS